MRLAQPLARARYRQNSSKQPLARAVIPRAIDELKLSSRSIEAHRGPPLARQPSKAHQHRFSDALGLLLEGVQLLYRQQRQHSARPPHAPCAASPAIQSGSSKQRRTAAASNAGRQQQATQGGSNTFISQTRNAYVQASPTQQRL